MANRGAIAAALCCVASSGNSRLGGSTITRRRSAADLRRRRHGGSLDPGARWAAAWTGPAIALSLGIGLENMPFFVVARRGAGRSRTSCRRERAKERLVAFGAALGLLLVAVYVVTIRPRRWLDPACDALSIVHRTARRSRRRAAAFLVLVAAQPGRSPAARLAACVVAGGLCSRERPAAVPNGLQRSLHASVDPVLRASGSITCGRASPSSRKSRGATRPIAING